MNGKKDGTAPDIAGATGASDAFKPLSDEDFVKLMSDVPRSVRERVAGGYDMKALAKIFEDGAMMQTVNCFFKNDLNVCRTARELYMHRNTLIYRLNSILRMTGLDLRRFGTAMTFKVLHCLYLVK